MRPSGCPGRCAAQSARMCPPGQCLACGALRWAFGRAIACCTQPALSRVATIGSGVSPATKLRHAQILLRRARRHGADAAARRSVAIGCRCILHIDAHAPIGRSEPAVANLCCAARQSVQFASRHCRSRTAFAGAAPAIASTPLRCFARNLSCRLSSRFCYTASARSAYALPLVGARWRWRRPCCPTPRRCTRTKPPSMTGTSGATPARKAPSTGPNWPRKMRCAAMGSRTAPSI